MKTIQIVALILVIAIVFSSMGFFFRHLDEANAQQKKNIENKTSTIDSNDKQLIGGCGSVQLQYQQDCCNKVAEEKKVTHLPCKGEWKIQEGVCNWACSSLSPS